MGSGEEEAGGTGSWGDTKHVSSEVMSILENALGSRMGRGLQGLRKGGLQVSEEATKWSDQVVAVDGLVKASRRWTHRAPWDGGLRERERSMSGWVEQV